MKIVVVGLGKLGKIVSKRLVEEGHDLIVIDINETIIQEVVNDNDVVGYTGNGASYDVLKESSCQDADLLIACTCYDEVNILSCLVAKKLNIKKTIARVRNPEYAKQVPLLNEELGISTIINPDQDAANEIIRTVQFPSALKVETFANNKVNLIEIKLKEKSPLIGKTLIQMKEKYPFDVLVCAVKRNNEVYIPRGDFELQEEDNVYFAGSVNELVKLFKKLDLYRSKVKSAMLIGASKICYYVASELTKSLNSVKIIEKNKARCEDFSDLVSDAIVINGDATDHDLLLEEGIDKIDAVVTLTGMDETNIILSTYFNTFNCPKIITKVNNENYRAILGNVKLNSVISPKVISSDIIVRYVRGMESIEENSCQTMYHLVEDKIEALEFLVTKEFEFTSKQIKDLSIRPDILLACIIRSNKVIIPGGKDTIEKGDTLIVIAPHSSVKSVEDIVK